MLNLAVVTNAAASSDLAALLQIISDPETFKKGLSQLVAERDQIVAEQVKLADLQERSARLALDREVLEAKHDIAATSLRTERVNLEKEKRRFEDQVAQLTIDRRQLADDREKLIASTREHAEELEQVARLTKALLGVK